MNSLELEIQIAAAAAKAKGEPPKRTLRETLYENIIGSGEADTFGEKLGAAVNNAGSEFFKGVGRGARDLAIFAGSGGRVDVEQGARDAIDQYLPSVSGALSPKPQNTASEYMGTIGEFMVGRGFGGTAKQMATAGAMSEGAGQLTEGTSIEPAARFAGGLLGSIGHAAAGNAAAKRATVDDFINGTETTAELKARAKAKYEEGHRLGLKIKPAAITHLDTQLKGVASDAGLITPTGRVIENADIKQVFNLLEDFQKSPVSTRQMQSLRRQINSIAGNPDPNISRVGVQMKRAYDDFLGRFAPQFREGNELSTRAMRGEMMDRAEELADVRASQFSQSGVENALRTEFRQMDRNIAKGKTKGLREDQVDAIKDVSRGTSATNRARFVGKLAPRGAISMGQHAIPFAIGSYIGGPALGATAAGATASTGIAGGILANALQRAAARRASAVMRSTKPIPEAEKKRGLLPGLLGAIAAR